MWCGMLQKLISELRGERFISELLVVPRLQACEQLRPLWNILILLATAALNYPRSLAAHKPPSASALLFLLMINSTPKCVNSRSSTAIPLARGNNWILATGAFFKYSKLFVPHNTLLALWKRPQYHTRWRRQCWIIKMYIMRIMWVPPLEIWLMTVITVARSQQIR